MGVSYRYTSNTSLFGGGTFTIQGSTDGTNWVDVVSPNSMAPKSQYAGVYGSDPRNTFNLV